MNLQLKSGRKIMKTQNRIVPVVCYFLLTGQLLLMSAPSASAQNIALGKSYTLDPMPNYGWTTDSGDLTQLTDGMYTQGHFWTQPSTVGWDSTRIVVTIDLGSVQSISGLSFNTAAGSSNVQWPTAIYIFAADENKQFYCLGDLVALSSPPPASGYAVHQYSTHSLRTHARYVALAFSVLPAFAWSDEIEVYVGDPSWTNLPRDGVSVSDIKNFLQGKAITFCAQRRIQSDIDQIRSKVNGSTISSSAKSTINAELDAAAAVPNLNIPYSSSYKTILPLNTDHARAFKAHAYYWSALGRSPLTIWQSTLWGPLSLVDVPPQNQNSNITVDMMSNEYRAASFNLSNATQSDMTVNLTITGLPGGTNPSYITVHQVEWTDTLGGTPVAAALPVVTLQSGSYPITVKSGMTRQVWLTFHPAFIAAGSYNGQIQITGSGVSGNVPISFQIRKLTMSPVPTLDFGGWDYANAPPWFYGVTSSNRSSYLAHLSDHFVSVAWSTSIVLSKGTYDAQGNMITPPDTQMFDEWLSLWPYAFCYNVFAEASETLGSLNRGTPEFDQAVRAWAIFWDNHIRSKGRQPGQFNLLLVDEPGYSHAEPVILTWANAIHSAGIGLKVFENPVYPSLDLIDMPAMNACDILCPNREVFLAADQAYRDYFLSRQAQGTVLEFYSCMGPVRQLDPYAYHRLMAWICWQYKARGMHFWAFGNAAGESSWNEYVGRGYEFTPFFIDGNSITPGKHMEACREGIEDYEYFVMLRNLINEAISKGRSGEPLTRAQNLLANKPTEVIAAAQTTEYLWTDGSIDRSKADLARTEILQAMTDLKTMISRRPGDANSDGKVDVGDLGILAANYGGSNKNWAQGDFNGDGAVDVGDLGILAANYGSGTNQTLDFKADYAMAFGTTQMKDNSEDNDEINSTACSYLGLPLIACLVLIGLMRMKLDQ
jgi:hypothetical protein